MRRNSVSLGLRDGLDAAAIAAICKDSTSKIDNEIANDFSAWLVGTLNVCRASRDKELRAIARIVDGNTDIVKTKYAMEILWHMYYGAHFRNHLASAFGKERTDEMYAWISENITSHTRRAALYANMYKVAAFADLKRHLDKIDTASLNLLVRLVDTVMNTPCLVECNPLHMQQLCNSVAADQASIKERVISGILPDPNAGVRGLIEKTFSMIKDNLDPTGTKKGGQTSDELCLELCASPCGILLMTAAACIAGSTGLILFMAPLFTAWSATTAISGMVKEHADRADIHNFLKNTTTTLLTSEYRPDLQNQVAPVETETAEQPSQDGPSKKVTSSSLQLVVGSGGAIQRSGT